MARNGPPSMFRTRSEEHTSELQSLRHLVCRLLLEKKKESMTGTPAPAHDRNSASRPIGGTPVWRARPRERSAVILRSAARCASCFFFFFKGWGPPETPPSPPPPPFSI